MEPRARRESDRLTENERAADGPLPVDLSLYGDELRGCKNRAMPGSLITAGFGGRVYFPTAKGFLVLQVRPRERP
jgi:hypothetical protein